MLSRILSLPMRVIHAGQRSYDRRHTFPQLCENAIINSPFAGIQYQRDLASHSILNRMQNDPAWQKHYAPHDLGAEAAKIVINEITEAPDASDG